MAEEFLHDPQVGATIEQVGATLDAPELPELFVQANPGFNAMTIGLDRPIIVLNSALVDLLAELLSVGAAGLARVAVVSPDLRGLDRIDIILAHVRVDACLAGREVEPSASDDNVVETA